MELGIETVLNPKKSVALQEEMAAIILTGKTIHEAEVTQEEWNMVASHLRGCNG